MVLLLVIGAGAAAGVQDAVTGRFDLFSSVLSLAAVLPVIWGIKEIAAHGVEALPVVSIVVGLLRRLRLPAAAAHRGRTR